LKETEGRAEKIAESFRARLSKLRDAEIYRRVTLAGPQRDDLLLSVNGVEARIYGSQGQQRTVALSLRLAELQIMEESVGEPPIVLLDDVMTDLDEDRRAHVFQMTQGKCQTFITAASKRAFDADFLASASVYDVSEGRITAE
jgi:DNA replication and repair protein RecF